MTGIQDVAVVRIVPGDNDREEFEPVALRELVDSIAQHGLAQPITVRLYGAGYQIVAGERRWRAALLLGWETIPALVRELDDEAASAIMLLENIQRAELNPIEEARAYRKRMTQFGWDADTTARAANVPVERVRLRLMLLDVVPEAQQLIRDGQLGVKYAYVMRDLDANRQRLALRYLSLVDTPRLREFRELCARLLAEQAQEAMFDMAAFMTGVQVTRAQEATSRLERVIPVDADLPGVRKARSAGQALERYIRDLLDGGLDDAARVVGTVYQGLLAHGLVKLPGGPSPLIPGETL